MVAAKKSLPKVARGGVGQDPPVKKRGAPNGGSGGYHAPKSAESGPRRAPPILLEVEVQDDDVESFLRQVMLDPRTDVKVRVDAAKALLRCSQVKTSVSKKDATKTKAKEVAQGKFAPGAAPKRKAGFAGPHQMPPLVN